MARKSEQFLDGDILREARAMTGLSLGDTSAKAGIAKGHLSTLERGLRSGIGIDLLSGLSRGYDVDEAKLLLGLYRVQPENPEIIEAIETTEALKIGRQVMALDPSQKSALMKYIGLLGNIE